MGNSKIKKLWEFMKGNRIQFAIITFCIMMNVLLNYISPLIIAWTVDGIINRNTASIPAPVFELIKNLGGTDYLAANLWICAVSLLIITVLRGVFQFFQGYLTSIVSEGTVKRIKDAVYDHLQRLPFSYHAKAETGDLVQRCTTDVETVRRFLSGQLMELIRCFFILVFAVAILGRINILLTVMSLVLMPISFVYSYFFSNRIQKQFKLADEADGAMSTVLQENLTGVRVVRAFGREKFELEKYERSVQILKERLYKFATLLAQFWSFSDFTAMTQQAITLFGAMYYTINGSLSLGMFLVFNSYIGTLVWPIRQLGRVLSDASKMFISIGRISEIMQEKQEDSGENPQYPPISGDIVFDNVSFSYGGEPVLHDLTFTVKKGESVAILGSTGSGKSSLVLLLQRLYDYTGGSVTIGGVELKKIEKHYLRSKVGIVLQEPFLYSRSIFENIAITEERPECSRVFDAARIASVHDVIESFENKYDTIIGERGVTLSGGQKQRLAIARTLMRDNDILIFDDSLSAVDTETDSRIRGELRKNFRGTTKFIISHRISTLAEADKIIVLENGTVTASGKHEDLIAKEGLYKRIWEIQNAADTPEDELPA